MFRLLIVSISVPLSNWNEKLLFEQLKTVDIVRYIPMLNVLYNFLANVVLVSETREYNYGTKITIYSCSIYLPFNSV